jgi:large subunit ribosomal protein L18
MARSKNDARIKRHKRSRKRVQGSAGRPRLQVFRSLHHIYAAVIDDSKGATLVTASTRQKDVAAGLSSLTSLAAAKRVGEIVGQRAKAAGIGAVVFDTNGLKYHGRVAALAQAARDAGLEF